MTRLPFARANETVRVKCKLIFKRAVSFSLALECAGESPALQLVTMLNILYRRLHELRSFINGFTHPCCIYSGNQAASFP